MQSATPVGGGGVNWNNSKRAQWNLAAQHRDPETSTFNFAATTNQQLPVFCAIARVCRTKSIISLISILLKTCVEHLEQQHKHRQLTCSCFAADCVVVVDGVARAAAVDVADDVIVTSLILGDDLAMMGLTSNVWNM